MSQAIEEVIDNTKVGLLEATAQILGSVRCQTHGPQTFGIGTRAARHERLQVLLGMHADIGAISLEARAGIVKEEAVATHQQRTCGSTVPHPNAELTTHR